VVALLKLAAMKSKGNFISLPCSQEQFLDGSGCIFRPQLRTAFLQHKQQLWIVLFYQFDAFLNDVLLKKGC